MMITLLIAVAGIVGLMLLWLLVQQLWGRVFHEYLEEEDVMAGRTKCTNCGCSTACKRKQFIEL